MLAAGLSVNPSRFVVLELSSQLLQALGQETTHLHLTDTETPSNLGLTHFVDETHANKVLLCHGEPLYGLKQNGTSVGMIHLVPRLFDRRRVAVVVAGMVERVRTIQPTGFHGFKHRVCRRVHCICYLRNGGWAPELMRQFLNVLAHFQIELLDAARCTH